MIACDECKSSDLSNMLMFGNGREGIVSYTCNKCNHTGSTTIKEK